MLPAAAGGQHGEHWARYQFYPTTQQTRRRRGIGADHIRAHGAPNKGIENQSSGIISVMKLLEDPFSYPNQLGARQEPGAVYLHAHPLAPDRP